MYRVGSARFLAHVYPKKDERQLLMDSPPVRQQKVPMGTVQIPYDRQRPSLLMTLARPMGSRGLLHMWGSMDVTKEAQKQVCVTCLLLKSKRVMNHRSGGRPMAEATASARAQKIDGSGRGSDRFQDREFLQIAVGTLIS